MTATTKAIAHTLREIVGEESVASDKALIQAEAKVAQALVPGTAINCIVYPKTQAELSEVMACVHRNQWRVLPCGSGTKLDWGGLAEGIDLIVSTERLNRLIDHAAGDLTVTVEAGLKFIDLQTILAKAGQFLALDPAYSNLATVGGIVATRDAGSLRQQYGGVRDIALGVAFARADGQLVKAGGRVVKNVAGYDLVKLLSGSFGTLGIISEVTFRVYPLPEASKTILLTGAPAAIAEAIRMLIASVLTPTGVDLVSAQALAQSGRTAPLALVARFQSLQTSVDEQATSLLKTAQALGLKEEVLVEREEASFWQQIHNLFWRSPSQTDQSAVCKLGVLPARAITTLIAMDSIARQNELTCTSLIHAGSGLGLMRLEGALPEISQSIPAVRALCEQGDGISDYGRKHGFLSILSAPPALKQKLDVWGYPGNALELMRKIKEQFDPQHLLSPNRFIGRI